MDIVALKNRPTIAADTKLSRTYSQFGELIDELRKKGLSQSVMALINDSIEQINASTLAGEPLRKLVKKKQTSILKQTEKEHKIVPKNHYRNIWMAFGLTALGLSLGLIFGSSVGNIGLMGVGLPIGMGIGIAIGSSLDKKAFNEGRQLNVEIKH